LKKILWILDTIIIFPKIISTVILSLLWFFIWNNVLMTNRLCESQTCPRSSFSWRTYYPPVYELVFMILIYIFCFYHVPPIASEMLVVAHVPACLRVNTRNQRIFSGAYKTRLVVTVFTIEWGMSDTQLRCAWIYTHLRAHTRTRGCPVHPASVSLVLFPFRPPRRCTFILP